MTRGTLDKLVELSRGVAYEAPMYGKINLAKKSTSEGQSA